MAHSESESCSVMSDSLWPHVLYMEFSRPEYWSGYPIPSPADLPDPGIEPGSPALQEESLPTELSRFTNWATWFVGSLKTDIEVAAD